MKSLRVWLSGIALGAAMIFSAPAAKAQVNNSGVPNGFTYQGMIEDNGVPFSGNASFTISLSTQQSGVELWTETLANVPVSDGMFNIVVGGSTPFPATI
jgi:hypothetical protein